MLAAVTLGSSYSRDGWLIKEDNVPVARQGGTTEATKLMTRYEDPRDRHQ
jgi:hypothetical protein